MIFDTRLFMLISAFAVVAIVWTAPRQAKGILERRDDITAPPGLVILAMTIQQSLIAIALAAAGTALAPRIGLGAPWFSAVSRGEGIALPEAAAQLLPAFVVGGLSVLVFLLVYYRIFVPRTSADDVGRIREMRESMGLSGRILMGGVAEEVMFRWGVMSILAWLALDVLSLPTTTGMWSAITMAALLFGLGHLPGVVAAGTTVTRRVAAMAVILNLVPALAFGWLFWQHGLFAAIVAHALLHAVWHPLEGRLGGQRRVPTVSS